MDLPGLVATGVSCAETKVLVEEHIRRNDARSIYLLTCPGAVAPNTSLAVDVVTKHNLQVTYPHGGPRTFHQKSSSLWAVNLKNF